MKRCITCNFVKPFAEFYPKKSECKECTKDRSLKRQLMVNFGITKEEKEEMVQMQGGRCALCGIKFEDPKTVNVDHCHTNGGIRGILCRHCNLGLGHFKDSPKLLRRAINYLKDYAKTLTATPVSTGHHPQGEEHTQLGFVFAAGFGEDDDNPYNHCGADARKDADHRAQESSGDSVGRGGQEVESFGSFAGLQDHRLPDAEVIWSSGGSGHLPDKP